MKIRGSTIKIIRWEYPFGGRPSNKPLYNSGKSKDNHILEGRSIGEWDIRLYKSFMSKGLN